MNTILGIILIASLLILEGVRWAVTIKLCGWKMEWSIKTISMMFAVLLLFIISLLLVCMVCDFVEFFVSIFLLCLFGAALSSLMRSFCGIDRLNKKKEKKINWISWGVIVLLFVGYVLSCWMLNLKKIDRRWAEAEPVKVESVCFEAVEGESFKVRLSGLGIENAPLEKEAWKQMCKVLGEHGHSGFSFVSKDGRTVRVSKNISDLDLYVRYMDYYGFHQRFEIVSVRMRK